MKRLGQFWLGPWLRRDELFRRTFELLCGLRERGVRRSGADSLRGGDELPDGRDDDRAHADAARCVDPRWFGVRSSL